MKNTRKRLSKVLALGCVAALMISSLAYFTDHVSNKGDELEIASNSGTIIIEPTDPDNIVPDDEIPEDEFGKELEYIWTNKNSDKDLKAPGDYVDLTYELNNESNMAIDVRETFVIRSSVAFENMTSPEFRMWTVAAKDALGAMVGETALTVETIGADYIVYKVAAFTLSGVKETVAGAATSKVLDYTLVFDKYADNSFQSANCKLDYLVEVKQHTNDGLTSDWSNVVTLEGLTLGNQTVNAVPVAQ